MCLEVIAQAEGWPIQARFWLEWGSSELDRVFLPLFHVFVSSIPTRSALPPHSRLLVLDQPPRSIVGFTFAMFALKSRSVANKVPSRPATRFAALAVGHARSVAVRALGPVSDVDRAADRSLALRALPIKDASARLIGLRDVVADLATARAAGAGLL